LRGRLPEKSEPARIVERVLGVAVETPSRKLRPSTLAHAAAGKGSAFHASKSHHVVIRHESNVDGTRERPEVGISDQSHSSHDRQAANVVQLARRSPDRSPEEQTVVWTWLTGRLLLGDRWSRRSAGRSGRSGRWRRREVRRPAGESPATVAQTSAGRTECLWKMLRCHHPDDAT
jgi:hypothetical protein